LNGYRLAIILKIKNWTDFAAELLRSDAELPACFMGGGNSRLEITVISDYEPYSPPMCNITEPAGLRNITVFYAFSGKTDPRASKMKEVYVRLKDRLTGYSVFSQPVALP
jgi:hypothetical protein